MKDNVQDKTGSTTIPNLSVKPSMTAQSIDNNHIDQQHSTQCWYQSTNLDKLRTGKAACDNNGIFGEEYDEDETDSLGKCSHPNNNNTGIWPNTLKFAIIIGTLCLSIMTASLLLTRLNTISSKISSSPSSRPHHYFDGSPAKLIPNPPNENKNLFSWSSSSQQLKKPENDSRPVIFSININDDNNNRRQDKKVVPPPIITNVEGSNGNRLINQRHEHEYDRDYLLKDNSQNIENKKRLGAQTDRRRERHQRMNNHRTTFEDFKIAATRKLIMKEEEIGDMAQILSTLKNRYDQLKVEQTHEERQIHDIKETESKKVPTIALARDDEAEKSVKPREQPPFKQDASALFLATGTQVVFVPTRSNFEERRKKMLHHRVPRRYNHKQMATYVIASPRLQEQEGPLGPSFSNIFDQYKMYGSNHAHTPHAGIARKKRQLYNDFGSLRDEIKGQNGVRGERFSGFRGFGGTGGAGGQNNGFGEVAGGGGGGSDDDGSDNTCPCKPAPAGPPGIPGKDGEIGPEGPPGPPGKAGEPGPFGQDGIPGKPGPRGLTGPPGNPGFSAGSPGKDGPFGVPGKDGFPGRDGQSGRPGNKGKPGQPGAPGRDGEPGLDGLSGKDGQDGQPGKDGLPGPKGPPGNPGFKGRDGAPGSPGRPGNDGRDGGPGTPGKDGLPGLDGPPGPTGAPGPDGNNGFSGAPGKDALPGRDGQPGRDGSPGRIGPPGSPGLPGKDGNSGSDGIPGDPGKDGLPGPPGLDGLPGKDGLSGPPGSPGKEGLDGEPGLDGKPGKDGEDGFPGKDGEPGRPGPRGDSGNPGKDGKDGFPGIPGKDKPDGHYGIPGKDGDSGPPGPPGPLGDKGPPGRPGRPGGQGKEGPKGPKGETGDAGLPGYPGRRGRPGKNGGLGIRGIRGPPGDVGFPGNMGSQGLRGHDGDAGPPGEPGPPGEQGDSGIPGQAGSSGEPASCGPCPAAQLPDLEDIGGTSYVRWGADSCPPSAIALYSGYVSGGHYLFPGSGANYLCLPTNPSYGTIVQGVQSMSFIYGAEYRVYPDANPFVTKAIKQKPAVCAFCYLPKIAVSVMIPAKQNCPPEWDLQYQGFIMSLNNQFARSEYICVDTDAEVSHHNMGKEKAVKGDGSALYLVSPVCSNGILDCAIYANDKIINCVVCSR